MVLSTIIVIPPVLAPGAFETGDEGGGGGDDYYFAGTLEPTIALTDIVIARSVYELRADTNNFIKLDITVSTYDYSSDSTTSSEVRFRVHDGHLEWVDIGPWTISDDWYPFPAFFSPPVNEGECWSTQLYFGDLEDDVVKPYTIEIYHYAAVSYGVLGSFWTTDLVLYHVDL